jgi:3'-phosphoadenosine 5'-phosphosulfate sulfotransferase (PAPS reductase)/FAD synthetase
MLDIVTKADTENKVSYVFFNTGIEYEATKKHLKYLENKYGIEIKEHKAKTPVPFACRKCGQPFLSKNISEMICRLQKHNFKWEDKPFEELYKEYPKCKAALRWWCNDNGERSKFNINYYPYLKEFMVENPPDFLISSKCCEHAKKHVAKEALKEEKCDLVMIGVRKAEGGVRSTAYKSCFSDATAKVVANFRPLFWFTNADKKEYENIFNITHSECYTKYGLDRTGCAGCPFGKYFEKELEIIKEFEPKLFGAVNKIFGKSYEYTRNYYKYRKEAKEREKNDR